MSAQTPHPYLETARLIIRHMVITDAEDVYDYAKDPDVGPMAGWSPHTSLENTIQILTDFFTAPNNPSRILNPKQRYVNPYFSSKEGNAFAVVLKETGKVIGKIGYKDLFNLSRIVDLADVVIKHPMFGPMECRKRGVESIDEAELKTIANKAIFSDWHLTRFDPDLVKIRNQVTSDSENADENGNSEEPHLSTLCNMLEVGYVLHRSYWGQGYIPEAINAFIYSYLIPQFHPVGVLITTLGSNEQSRRVAEKVGGVHVGTYSQCLYRRSDDTRHDGFLYMVLNQEGETEK